VIPGQLLNCRTPFGACLYTLLFLISLSLGTGNLLASPRYKAMLIIDGSISMSGKIDKKSKISLVQKALSSALKSARSNLDLGVVAYGIRRRGDCGDAQHMIRLGSIFPKRYMKIIKGITPMGRAPFAKAIKLAAGILKKQKGKSNSIVWITDGFDACDKNLGTLAKKLQKDFPDLKVNVIALRSKTSKMTSLRQLARRTRGKFIAANTASAINQAVRETFLLASGGKIPLPRPDPRRLSQQTTILAVSEEVSRAQAETLQATTITKAEAPKTEAVTPPTAPIESLDTVKIISPKPVVLPSAGTNTSKTTPSNKKSIETQPDESTASIFASFFGPGKKTQDIIASPQPSSPASAAIETPVAKTSPARNVSTVTRKPEVQEKPQGQNKNLAQAPAKSVEAQQSGLTLSARLGSGGAQIDKDLFWRIFAQAKNGNPPKEIRQTGAAQPLLDLKPGKYTVTVQFGTVVQRQQISVRANKITEAVITIEAGIIQARAIKVAGGKLLNQDVSYTLLSNKKDDTGNQTQISRKTASQTRFFVKPGRYQLVGKFGSTTITSKITVFAGKTSVANLIFNTGILKVSSIAGKGGAIVRGATYIVYQIEAGSEGPRKVIGKSSDDRAPFTLPAGTYRLRIERGLASLERTIKIEANKTKVLVFNLNAGYLKLSARPAIGAKILSDKVHYTIYKGAQSLDGKREKITQSTKTSPTFWLPAGEYYIKANYGLASADIAVQIKANQRTEKTVIINAGALRLSSKVEGLPEKLKSQVFYVIYDAKADLEGNYREIFTTSQAERTVRIPPGEYLIEGRWGNTNAKTPVSAVVTAGKLTSATVIHRAGRARFKLTSVRGGTPTGKPYWTFYDFSGTEIGRNVKPSPERIFSEGKYSVVVRYDDQEFKAAFTIKSGDEKQIDIVATQ
jgi:Ca-activated chloride channel homolog